jgi:hypothetical protein
MIDAEEYRYLNGWSKDKKRGSSRCDRIPVDIVDEIWIENTADYLKLIPPTLDKQFTSKDYKKESKLPLSESQTALNVLHHIGAVNRVSKQGNLYVYEKNSPIF